MFTPTVYKSRRKSYKLTIISPHLVPRNSNGKQYVIAICDISTNNKGVSLIIIPERVKYHGTMLAGGLNIWHIQTVVKSLMNVFLTSLVILEC